jgi:signal transduction histidine kinase
MHLLMSFSRYWLLLTILLFAIDVKAQTNNQNIINRYTNDNGLSQNEISDIAMDHNGFLWICTQGGLLRFDGSKFWHYNSTNSILSVERTARVAINKLGKVFIKSSKPGDIIYTVDNNYQLIKDTVFSKYKNVAFFPQHDPVPIEPLLAKGEQRYGQAFAASKIPILENRFGLSGDNRLYYTQNEQYHYSLESIHTKTGIIEKYALNADDVLCYAILGDVLFFMDKRQQFSVIGNGRVLSSPSGTPTFYQLLGLIKRSRKNEVIFHRQGANNSLIIQLRDDLWHVFNNKGTLDARIIFKGVNIGEVSTSLYDEKNGTLFIGTFTKGLYVVKRNPFQTLLFSKDDPAKNVTYAQIQINSRQVVNRYYKYSPYDTSFTPFKDWQEISAYYKTRDHKILSSTTSDIIVRDSDFQTVNTIPFPEKNANNIVGCFLEDEQNTIWFASYNALGFIRNGKPVYKIYGSEYFLKNKISVLFNLDTVSMWIGHENGIFTYNKKTGKPGTLLHLPGHNVRTIYRAKDSSIWIGTYGKGFYKYLNGRFIAMPLDAEKHLLFTHSFNEDDHGFFWIPTNNGLLQCKKEELDAYAANPGSNHIYYYYYRKSNEYTNEFNGGSNPASVKFNELLLLPSLEGVVSFAPNTMQPELPNKSLIIERMTVDDQELKSAGKLSLPADFRQLEFNISAPYMGDRINNIIEYNLKEIGSEWYPVINGRIIYNQLPKGSYHLTIRKRIGFGINNYAYHQVAFSVAPFWYQTIAFFVLFVLVIAGFVYYLVRLRFRVMERKQRHLENVVNERTEALRETIAELHLSEEHLNGVNEIQEQAIAIILHDIQSPIRHLSTSAKAFDKQIDHLSPEDIREYSGNLAESTDMINNFTGQLLNWLIFNRDNKKVLKEKIQLPALLLDIKNLYHEIAQINGNEIVIEHDLPEELVTDRNKLALVIRNLVDNATKNCTDGTITLSGRYSPDHHQVILSVADTGRGMTAAEVELLQQPVQEFISFPKEKLGFNLVREFLRSINGYYEIESQKDKGTVIHIFLPAAGTHQP